MHIICWPIFNKIFCHRFEMFQVCCSSKFHVHSQHEAEGMNIDSGPRQWSNTDLLSIEWARIKLLLPLVFSVVYLEAESLSYTLNIIVLIIWCECAPLLFIYDINMYSYNEKPYYAVYKQNSRRQANASTNAD